MTQTFTALDTFDLQATPHSSAYFPGEYLRYKPWTGAQSVGGGDTTYSITAGVGTFTDAYQGVAEGASVLTLRNQPLIDTRAVFCSENADTNNDYLYAALWRRGWVKDGTVTSAATFLEYTSTAANSLFRWFGLCARVQNQTLSEVAGSEHLLNGDGYWLLWCNVGVNRNWKLVRVNAGVPTVLASQAMGSNNPVVYWKELRTVTMRVRTVGAAVVITCQTAAAPGPPTPIGPGVPPVNLLFGGDVSDTSASRLVNPGRWGFGGRAASGGLAFMFERFKLQSEDPGNTGILMDDYWQRSADFGFQVHKNGSSGGDANGVTGSSLMGRYTNDAHCLSTIGMDNLDTVFVSGGVDYLCVEDLGDTAKYALDVRPATNAYQSRRTVKWYKNGIGSTEVPMGILVRGTYSASAVHSSKLSSGYMVQVVGTYTPDHWEARLYLILDAIGGSGARLIATASLGIITDFNLTANNAPVDLQVLNVGPSAPISGDVQVILKVSNITVGSAGHPPWSISYVDGGVTANATTGALTLLQAGSGIPPGSVQSGVVEGMYLGSSSGGVLSCALNDWDDLAPDLSAAARVEHFWPEYVIRPTGLNVRAEHFWPEYVIRPSGLNVLVEHFWPEYVIVLTHTQAVTGLTVETIGYHAYSPSIAGELTVSVTDTPRIAYHAYPPVVAPTDPPVNRAHSARMMNVLSARKLLGSLRVTKATLG